MGHITAPLVNKCLLNLLIFFLQTVHVARREISRLKQKFAKLSMKVSDLLKEKKIQVSELVRFLRYYSCHDNDFLKDHLPELESKESIDEAVIFLQRFSSFGNPELMQVIVANFIETEAGALMDSYYNELQDFEMSCQCSVYAQAFTAELHPGQNGFISYHSHSSDNILLHLNDLWDQRPISDLRSWQTRELQVIFSIMPPCILACCRCLIWLSRWKGQRRGLYS